MVINFENAKLDIEINKIIKKLRKIYNDIEIRTYFMPNEFLEIQLKKGFYIRKTRICLQEIKNYNIEQLLKFHLNNFCYEVYEKREQEINEKNRRK